MPKSPAQSDFVYESPHIDTEADMAEHGANPIASRWVLRAIAIALFVMAALLIVALHIPSGG